ncbi:hypothetical protein [Arthrobacter sp. Br18]|uniref:hypothetical protein n=1 Tax=Arthrobacter sp. Br18 TaxID=1312954 RepID=UPI0012DE9950|nr:hypothetical protein [Arthrobacter sp. Br18]
MTLLDRTATISSEAPTRARRPLKFAPLGGSYISSSAATADSEGTYVTTGSALTPSPRGSYVTTSRSRSNTPGRYTYSS